MGGVSSRTLGALAPKKLRLTPEAWLSTIVTAIASGQMIVSCEQNGTSAKRNLMSNTTNHLNRYETIANTIQKDFPSAPLMYPQAYHLYLG